MCKISLLRTYQKVCSQLFYALRSRYLLELDIPLSTLRALIYSQRTSTLPKSTLPLTQPVSLSNLSRSSEMKARVSTLCAPLDRLLSGGVSRGSVLEISGAPGTPKEILAVNIVASFVKAGERVLFVDLQNMTSAVTLRRSLKKIPDIPTNFLELVSYMPMHTLSEVMKFMYNLSSYLRINPDVGNSSGRNFDVTHTLALGGFARHQFHFISVSNVSDVNSTS
ncbi:hypothetical protein ARMSODRAFT_310420 [Armillaria solidipes]|uniref:KaiC-like domain-containing protein n=1 Tax=Armillaria solidipes TaxID=1076256 RepID=A0A2H3BN51_9AGAR|nr:hypothetical protein ARMSODRAFT_310420 [Armillaria solidipes]